MDVASSKMFPAHADYFWFPPHTYSLPVCKKKTGELKLLFRNTQEINRISGVGQILMEDYVGKKLALYKSIFTFIQFTLRFPFEIVAEDITG